MNLDQLPVVITTPGMYRTRGGKLARIIEIRGPSTFEAKGEYLRWSKPHERWEYAIWHVSGRWLATRESLLDIVEKV